MGLFDQAKKRLATNFKFTQLSFMTQPAQIVAFCQNLTPEERTGVLKGIESAFRWQPVAQIAEAMYPMFTAQHADISGAADLARGGFISGAVDMMAMQSQAPPPPQIGMTSQQQATLAFAWMVLQGLQTSSLPDATPAAGRPNATFAAPSAATSVVNSEVRFCSRCGSRTQPHATFCSSCGRRL